MVLATIMLIVLLVGLAALSYFLGVNNAKVKSYEEIVRSAGRAKKARKRILTDKSFADRVRKRARR